MDDVPQRHGGLRHAALSGARWTGAARLIAEVTGFAAVVITARLLEPSEVGQAAVALVAVALAIGLTQQGIGAAIVRGPEPSALRISTGHSISLAIGVVVGATLFFVAPALTALLGDAIPPLLQLAALAFPLAALGAIPMALLQRDLDFRQLALVDGAASFLGAMTTIVAAAAGLGAAAMIVGPLVLCALTSVGCLLIAPRVRFGWSTNDASELTRFGLPVAGSGLLYVAFRNVDYAILAIKLPAASVGYYFRAYQLGSEYQAKVSGVLLRMALPLFARAESPRQLRSIRTTITRVHAVVLFPLLVGLIGAAPEAVPFIFGEQWTEAVTPTRILAISGMIAVVGTGSGPLLTASGHPKALFVFNALAALIYGSAIYLAADHGIVAVSAAAVGVQFVTLIVLQRFVIQPLVGIPATDVLKRDITPAAVASVPILVATLAAGWAGQQLGATDFVVLLVGGTVGAVGYLIALRTFFPDVWADLHALARRREPGDVPIATAPEAVS